MRIGIFFVLLGLFATFVLVSHVRQICALFSFAYVLCDSLSAVVLFVYLSRTCVMSSHSNSSPFGHIIWYGFRCKAYGPMVMIEGRRQQTEWVRVKSVCVWRIEGVRWGIEIEESTSWTTTIKMITMWDVGFAIERIEPNPICKIQKKFAFNLFFRIAGFALKMIWLLSEWIREKKIVCVCVCINAFELVQSEHRFSLILLMSLLAVCELLLLLFHMLRFEMRKLLNEFIGEMAFPLECQILSNVRVAFVFRRQVVMWNSKQYILYAHFDGWLFNGSSPGKSPFPPDQGFYVCVFLFVFVILEQHSSAIGLN